MAALARKLCGFRSLPPPFSSLQSLFSLLTPPYHKRIIYVGDVHGCYDEFIELLESPDLHYRPGRDTLVMLGDFVNKGPDSASMVTFLRAHQSAYPDTVKIVLGNHELQLLAFAVMEASERGDEVGVQCQEPSTLGVRRILDKMRAADCACAGNEDPIKTEKRMKKRAALKSILDQLELGDVVWLRKQAMLLQFPPLTSGGPPMIAVHAGVNAFRALDQQDPWEVAHVRNIICPSLSSEIVSEKSSIALDLWRGKELPGSASNSTCSSQGKRISIDGGSDSALNGSAHLSPHHSTSTTPLSFSDLPNVQTTLPPLATEDSTRGVAWVDLWKGPELVVYGHDASKGINIHPHSVGLDSGCVYGGQLSAFVMPERKMVHVKAHKVYSPSSKPS